MGNTLPAPSPCSLPAGQPTRDGTMRQDLGVCPAQVGRVPRTGVGRRGGAGEKDLYDTQQATFLRDK